MWQKCDQVKDLKEGEYSGLPAWAQHDHKGIYKRKAGIRVNNKR